jgi:hypothetical protein
MKPAKDANVTTFRIPLLTRKAIKVDDSDTSSAPDAMFYLPVNLCGDEVQSSSVKCTVCKGSTTHHWVKVQPWPQVEVDPMELLKLTKRFLMCTQCGTFRLTN